MSRKAAAFELVLELAGRSRKVGGSSQSNYARDCNPSMGRVRKNIVKEANMRGNPTIYAKMPLYLTPDLSGGTAIIDQIQAMDSLLTESEKKAFEKRADELNKRIPFEFNRALFDIRKKYYVDPLDLNEDASGLEPPLIEPFPEIVNSTRARPWLSNKMRMQALLARKRNEDQDYSERALEDRVRKNIERVPLNLSIEGFRERVEFRLKRLCEAIIKRKVAKLDYSIRFVKGHSMNQNASSNKVRDSFWEVKFFDKK